MTKDNHIEGNKLIAEFMGGKVNDKMICHPYPKGLPEWASELYDFDTMRIAGYDYDCSWDWLMPVIEKISQIPLQGPQVDVSDVFYPRTFGMRSEEGQPMFRFHCMGVFAADTLIEAAWLVVVDFIKWQNEKTKHHD